eukprot:CAMPEP_0119019418 /NCGR_PEP_ID=MMETSP1176-20130426/21759_1 /TAXON_ID=265551 /ORGANISM="Synedropsis recta cf, Strain CCMP1620" /LENGTH=222 /DNA_ID=CAMNT_0006973605 /DNA_START=80 /DNA_END=748 /DNA_ORIENTATION=+
MTNYKTSLALFAMATMSANAFAPAPAFTSARAATSSMASTMNPEDYYFMEEKSVVESAMSMMQDIDPPTPVAPKKKAIVKKAGAHGKEGVFSPAVMAAKTVLGDAELNKLRGKAIGMHSKVIGDFVATSDSQFGQSVLKQLFAAADADRNGTLEENELEKFLHTLGFDFLNAKQVRGIFARADADSDGHIDLEEWMKEAPKTLRTNLIKLAKKNGGEMGFLA